MNTNRNYLLPVFAALSGLAACGLHLAVTRFCVDEKGLLMPRHPLAIALWVLTAATVLVILAGIRKKDGAPRYRDNFGPSLSAAAGSVAMAAGIFLTIFTGRFETQPMEILRNLVGVAAIPALVWAGIRRRDGKQPFFLCHGLVCIYLTLFIISRYQSWSSQSQILNFFFPMMGCVLSALFAYQQTAFCVGLGKRRPQLAAGLLGSFFCLVAIALGRDIPLYLAGSIWMLTGLCNLTPVPRRRKNPITEAPKEEPQ